MGDTSPPLSDKAQMFVDLAQQILNLNNGVDSCDPQNKITVDKAMQCLDLAMEEIKNYKAEEY